MDNLNRQETSSLVTWHMRDLQSKGSNISEIHLCCSFLIAVTWVILPTWRDYAFSDKNTADLKVAVTLCCPLELPLRDTFFDMRGDGPNGWL